MRNGMKLGIVGAIVAGLLALPGCGESTPEEFCATYNEERQTYLAKYGGTPEDELAAMGSIVGAISAWVPLLKQLENAAPPELAPDLSTSERPSRSSKSWSRIMAARASAWLSAWRFMA